MAPKINPNLLALLTLGQYQSTRFALVKYGGGIVQMSGSIAGDVHARNKSGNYIRPRTKPTNPQTARQVAARGRLSLLSEYWHEDLSDAERAAWAVYAAAVPMLNRLGETINLSGFNHFIRTNTLQLQLNEAIIDAAPGTLSLMDQDPTTLLSEEDIAAQTLTWTFNAIGWGLNPDDKYWMFLYQGLPQLQSRTFFKGPWRLLSAAGTVAGAVGTQTLPGSFPFALGQRQWTGARLVSQSGRTSTFWAIPSRVIEADP